MPQKTLSNGNGRGPQDLGPFVRRKEIAARTTLSIALLHGLIAQGQFPPYVKFGPRVAGLPADILDGWIESRMDARARMRTLSDPVTLPRWDPCVRSGALPPGIRILCLAEVLERTGVEKTTLYQWIHRSKDPFPWPVPLTRRRRGWVEHEMDAWMREHVERVLSVRNLTIGGLVRRNLELDPPHDSDPPEHTTV